MKRLWLLVIACSLLAALLTGCAIVDTGTMPQGPIVHMNGADFVQHSITIQKGQSLTLIDDASVEHIITNGSWANGVAKPKQEAGAPKVYQTFHSNDSATIGPWNTPGTYHLYCTIHQNMNLTVVVK